MAVVVVAVGVGVVLGVEADVVEEGTQVATHLGNSVVVDFLLLHNLLLACHLPVLWLLHPTHP